MSTRVIEHCNHKQNEGLGAENIVIYELKRAKIWVRNPCMSIRAYHLHCTNERSYSNHVYVNGIKGGPYRKRNGISKPEPPLGPKASCDLTVF